MKDFFQINVIFQCVFKVLDYSIFMLKMLELRCLTFFQVLQSEFLNHICFLVSHGLDSCLQKVPTSLNDSLFWKNIFKVKNKVSQDMLLASIYLPSVQDLRALQKECLRLEKESLPYIVTYRVTYKITYRVTLFCYFHAIISSKLQKLIECNFKILYKSKVKYTNAPCFLYDLK